MSELEAFDRELAELEKVTGIHIAEQEETYSIFLKTDFSTMRRTWNAPEPWKLDVTDCLYLCSLGFWAWYAVAKYLAVVR